MFGGGMFDAFGGPQGMGMMQGRHAIKLMYTRKAADGKLLVDDDMSSPQLNSYIHGSGKGLTNTVNLQFWNKNKDEKSTLEEGWESEDVDNGNLLICNHLNRKWK
jgi:hypothetical protein